MNLIISCSGRVVALPFPALRSIQAKVVERVASEDWGKIYWILETFSSSVVTRLMVVFVRECASSDLCFLSDILWEPFFVFLPCSPPVVLWLSWPHPSTSDHHVILFPGDLSLLPLPFPSCLLVWPASLHSAIPLSCLPFSISYTWTSRALALH